MTTFAWTSAGQLLSSTNALDEATAYQYDDQGYLLRIINANGHIAASFTYDNAGRIASTTDDSNYSLIYAYDALDRLTRITYPDGSTQQWGYDKLDRVSATDRLGRSTQYQYNPVRQLEQVTDALGQITRYGWCACGSLATLTDALGQITTFNHDLQGRLNSKRYADGQGIDYQYEASTSRLKTRTDALGQQARYSYDKNNAIIRISYSNSQHETPDRQFQYDSVYPRLTAFDNGAGFSFRSYQATGQYGAGQLAGETSPDSIRTRYNYDPLNRLQSMAVIRPDDSQLNESYSYDSLERLIQNDTELGAFHYSYQTDSSRLEQVLYPNQSQSQYAYHDLIGDLRLKTYNHLAPSGTLLAGNQYSYDVEGQINTWQRSGIETANESYQYDAIGQLLQVSGANGHKRAIPAIPAHDGQPAIRAIPPKRQPDARLQYAYDAAANRTEETLGEQSRYADYNDLNQLQNNSGDMYSYDAEGNLSQRQSQTLGNTTYRWDAENRLIALEDSDHPATRSEFHYDALGRRIGIQDFSNGISQRDDRLIYCGGRLCAKQDTLSGQFTRYYREAASLDGLGRYYHRDHLGSVRAVTDDTGADLATYSYDPYGRQTTLSGQADSSDFGYTGHYHHAASGLALAPYRAYDADIGRWLSRDPIGLAGGLNTYAYVGNNPVNALDPLGLTQKDIDAARSIATRSQPDLRFPNSYGSRDLGYTENGRRITGLTIPGFGTILDDQYQKPLSDQQACELLNTIIHEGVHFTLKPDDRRQDDENGSGYPYTEGDRRTTKKLCEECNRKRK